MKMLGALVAALAAAIAFAAPAAAQDEDHFTVTPYIWLPNIDGNLRFNIPPGADGSPNVEVGPNDYLENLEMALMIAGEARFGRVSAFTDLIYLDFGTQGSSVVSVTGPLGNELPIDIGSEVEFKGLLWTLAGGYELVHGDNFTLQAFGGVRYLSSEADLNWTLSGPLNQFPQSGATDRDTETWDGLVGVRGEGRAGNWIFPYYLDVGAGDSDLTWQALAGVGYRWGWGDLRLSYRHIAYEQGDGELIEDVAFSGPAIGASFRF
jgi:hypothetical protein